jgi:hypothetical protein
MNTDPHIADERCGVDLADIVAGTVEDRIGAVARDARLTSEQTQLFRTVSESMAADGWELTDAELRAGAEFAAGRADHLSVHDDPDELGADPTKGDGAADPILRQPQVHDAGAAADDVIARARTAVEVITAHRQQMQHRDLEQARAGELRRWHTSDRANVQQVTSELSGPSSAGAAW